MFAIMYIFNGESMAFFKTGFRSLKTLILVNVIQMIRCEFKFYSISLSNIDFFMCIVYVYKRQGNGVNVSDISYIIII